MNFEVDGEPELDGNGSGLLSTGEPSVSADSGSNPSLEKTT